jgi:primosomal protein N'
MHSRGFFYILKRVKIISVIPIVKGVLKKELTYFSSKDIHVGDIVSVLVRKKESRALVTSVSDLSSNKSSVKAGDFELKKVLEVVSKSPLEPGFIEAARKTASAFVTSPGALLFRMIPSDLLEKGSQKKNPKSSDKEIASEILTLQASFEDRLGLYKTFIRECFAKKESLFICLPNSQDIELFSKSLEKGIGKYIFSLHGDMTKNKISKVLSSMSDEDHSKVILGTPSFLYTLNKETKTIILEHESSPIYKTFVEPFFDMRTFVRNLSKETKRRLILADTILQTETIWESKEGLIENLHPMNFRFPQKSSREILDTKRKEDEKWKLITDNLHTKIEQKLKHKKSVFLFTLRKGLAPFTSCGDCGKTLLCPNCKTPLTLYKEKSSKDRLFVCNTCGHDCSAIKKCEYCESWNLRPLGVGTELIEEYLNENFPDTPVFVLDQNHAKTKTQAKKIISEFEKTAGAVLVGTELALHYNLAPIPLVSIVSFDSLFAIPSFRIHERILHLLIRLEELSEDNFMVQTKNPDAPILRTFEDNTFIQYYNGEITERRNFNYPPFTTLIKIIPDSKTKKSEIKKIAEQIFGQYNPSLFITTHKKKKLPAILLKVPREKWEPNHNKQDLLLKETLLGLPISWTIQVSPENT